MTFHTFIVEITHMHKELEFVYVTVDVWQALLVYSSRAYTIAFE